MRKLMNKIGLVIFMLFVIQPSIANADYTKELKISSTNKSIKFGEPLIVILALKYQKPQISPRTQKIRLIIELDGLSLHVQNKDNNEKTVFPFFLLSHHTYRKCDDDKTKQ